MDESDPVSESTITPIDPLDEPAPRRCPVCGRVLRFWRRKVCAGDCRRTWRTMLQRARRRKDYETTPVVPRPEREE